MSTKILFVASAICFFVNTQFLFAEATLLYDVDFSSPPHVVGQTVKTGDTAFPRKTPYSIYTGNSKVERTLGQLRNQPLVCRGNNTMYFIVDPEDMKWYYHYTFEMDILMTDGVPQDDPNPSWGGYNSLKIFLDTPQVRDIYFETDGDINVRIPGSFTRKIGSYTRDVPFHLKMEIDLELQEWKIFLDDSLLGTFDFKTDTLEDFRLITWSYESIPVGIDNVKISGDKLSYPDITEFSITGPNTTIESFSEQLNAAAVYNNGYLIENVSDSAKWSLSSNEYASIDNSGLLEVGDIDSPKTVTVYAEFSRYGVTVNAKKSVTLWPHIEEVRYTVTDLGTLGGSRSKAYAINDLGQVAGESTTSGYSNHHAFFHDGTTMHDLGTLGGTDSEARGINDSGHVVGFSETSGDSATHAFLHDGTTMHDLGTLGGPYSEATGINNSGQVVGWSKTPGSYTTHAFLYDGNTMHDLGTLGGSVSYAYGINDSGQVVGYSTTSTDDVHAFLYDGTEMHDLGALGGTGLNTYAINERGHIVGRIRVPGDSTYHAFSFYGTGTNALTTFGAGCKYAYAINDSGQVVGNRDTPEGVYSYQAFLYDRTKGLFDLNNLTDLQSEWILLSSTGINASGKIVGWGYNNEGMRGYLLTPNAEMRNYFVPGDLDGNSRVDLADMAMMKIEDLAEMAANWLTDCTIDPSDPACVPK